jgi:hypothetical protein
MADTEGATTPADEKQPSAEALALAEIGRNGIQPPARDPLVKEPAAPAVPEGVPAKFVKDGKVDLDALVKSYAELEKKFSAPPPADEPKADDPPADDGKDPLKIADEKAKADEKKPEEGGDDPAKALGPVFEAAKADYAANNGELSAEAREKLVAAGIPNDTIDLYLAGVKAQEKALAAQVYATAGGEEAYKAAVQWAAANWSDDEIEAFDSSLSGPSRDIAVKGLMAAFKEAGAAPSEGSFVDPKGGATPGDVYTDKNEFLVDLAKVSQIVDRNEQQLARKKAIEKLERSKKAGTVVSINPRRPTF